MPHVDATRLMDGALTKCWTPDIFHGPKVDLTGKLLPSDIWFVARLAAGFKAGEREVANLLYLVLSALPAVGLKDLRPLVVAQIYDEERHDLLFRLLIEHYGLDSEPVVVDERTALAEMNVLEMLRVELSGLETECTPDTVAGAVAAYHLLVEGVVGTTQFRIWDSIAAVEPFTPFAPGVTGLRTDEARHVATGQLIIERLFAVHGTRITDKVRNVFDRFLAATKRAITDPFRQDLTATRFGHSLGALLPYATTQFRTRLDALPK